MGYGRENLYLSVSCYMRGFVFRFLVLVKLLFNGVAYIGNLKLIVSKFGGRLFMKLIYIFLCLGDKIYISEGTA